MRLTKNLILILIFFWVGGWVDCWPRQLVKGVLSHQISAIKANTMPASTFYFPKSIPEYLEDLLVNAGLVLSLSLCFSIKQEN